MKKMTGEELQFELSLCPEIAREKLTDHIAELQAEVAQARGMALEETFRASQLLKGELLARVTDDAQDAMCGALDLLEDRIRALKSKPAQEASPGTTGEADQPLPCGPIEMASEENGLLPKRRRSRMPPCGHAHCEVLESGEEAHAATCPNFGTR